MRNVEKRQRITGHCAIVGKIRLRSKEGKIYVPIVRYYWSAAKKYHVKLRYIIKIQRLYLVNFLFGAHIFQCKFDF